MRVALGALALVGCHRGPAAPGARACPTTAVVASSQEQVDALAGCARLAALTVRSAAPLDLAPLAGLARVDGDLVIGPTLALTSIGLPALATVGGRFAVVANGAAGGVFAPALTAVGALEVRDDASLTTVSLPRLARVAGALAIVRVATLELVDASALAAVDGAIAIEVPAAATWLGARPGDDPPATTGP